MNSAILCKNGQINCGGILGGKTYKVEPSNVGTVELWWDGPDGSPWVVGCTMVGCIVCSWVGSSAAASTDEPWNSTQILQNTW